MRYQIDHDYHIHTRLSTCSLDETQTAEAILAYAKGKGLRKVCITNHFWDENVPREFRKNEWYENQNFAHISQVKPLPQDEEVELLFGCEADLDNNDTIGLSPERFDEFSFIVVATTHFHMLAGPKWEDRGPAALAKHWVQRLDKVLSSNLPLHKVGLAHLACQLISKGDWENLLATFNQIPQSELDLLFKKAAQKGVGVELNRCDFRFPDEDADTILRIFRTAKDCGCKFYIGSDAHNQKALACDNTNYNRAIDFLELQESDKFTF